MKRPHLRHKTSPAQPSTDAGPGDLRIKVDGGYDPDTVVAHLGQPVRLTFHREDASPCSERVVFADFGIDAYLPQHEDVTLEMSPQQAGDYDFTCGMGMLRGRLTVLSATEEPTFTAHANERKQP